MAEVKRLSKQEVGSDEPIWMELEELPHYDVRPRALAAILTGG